MSGRWYLREMRVYFAQVEQSFHGVLFERDNGLQDKSISGMTADSACHKD